MPATPSGSELVVDDDDEEEDEDEDDSAKRSRSIGKTLWSFFTT
jgi:hypothetical protein